MTEILVSAGTAATFEGLAKLPLHAGIRLRFGIVFIGWLVLIGPLVEQ